jgi:hypothetical protein
MVKKKYQIIIIAIILNFFSTYHHYFSALTTSSRAQNTLITIFDTMEQGWSSLDQLFNDYLCITEKNTQTINNQQETINNMSLYLDELYALAAEISTHQEYYTEKSMHITYLLEELIKKTEEHHNELLNQLHTYCS